MGHAGGHRGAPGAVYDDTAYFGGSKVSDNIFRPVPHYCPEKTT